MNTKLIMVILLGIAYVWLFVLAKRITEVLDEHKLQEWALEKEERDREIMTEHMEGLSEQLLEFVFDTSKVAKPVFEDDFQELLTRVFWSLPDEENSHVYVEGLNYEVGEHIVIKAEEAEMLLKIVSIIKTDEVNKSTELACEYVSWRKKKDRHSYADLHKMFYVMQEDLGNVKKVVLRQNSMRRREIDDVTNRVRENYARVDKEINSLKGGFTKEIENLEKELKELVFDTQARLMKENQDRENWTQDHVDASTSILNDEIKQLKEEVKELRREVESK